ncbi:MAG: response regulator transcription factor [Chloroflexi bacterium]|nr:response regulator transcription factor [Chloroflexota bacterium]
MSIIVVDPSRDGVRLAEGLLHGEQRVIMAENAEDSLELIRHSHPDIVFVNVDKTQPEAAELVRLIRLQSIAYDMTILGYQRAEDEAAAQRALEMGCDGVIVLPSAVGGDFDSLQAALAAATTQWQ